MTYMNKKKDTIYYSRALACFLDTQKKGGVTLQFGHGSTAVLRKCCVYVLCSCLDTAEALVQAGILFGRRKCRFCLAICNVFDPRVDPERRESMETRRMQTSGQRSFLRRIAAGNARNVTAEDKTILEINADLSVDNTNIKLHDHYERQFSACPKMDLFK